VKILLLAMMLTSCVTYPRYSTKYECTDLQKRRLASLVGRCTANMQAGQSTAYQIADACYASSLKAICSPQPYFERIDLLGNPSAAIECRFALTEYELNVCEN